MISSLARIVPYIPALGTIYVTVRGAFFQMTDPTNEQEETIKASFSEFIQAHRIRQDVKFYAILQIIFSYPTIAGKCLYYNGELEKVDRAAFNYNIKNGLLMLKRSENPWMLFTTFVSSFVAAYFMSKKVSTLAAFISAVIFKYFAGILLGLYFTVSRDRQMRTLATEEELRGKIRLFKADQIVDNEWKKLGWIRYWGVSSRGAWLHSLCFSYGPRIVAPKATLISRGTPYIETEDDQQKITQLVYLLRAHKTRREKNDPGLLTHLYRLIVY